MSVVLSSLYTYNVKDRNQGKPNTTVNEMDKKPSISFTVSAGPRLISVLYTDMYIRY